MKFIRRVATNFSNYTFRNPIQRRQKEAEFVFVLHYALESRGNGYRRLLLCAFRVQCFFFSEQFHLKNNAIAVLRTVLSRVV